jgi:hypothetical protein
MALYGIAASLLPGVAGMFFGIGFLELAIVAVVGLVLIGVVVFVISSSGGRGKE